jgi:hypothetical protein
MIDRDTAYDGSNLRVFHTVDLAGKVANARREVANAVSQVRDCVSEVSETGQKDSILGMAANAAGVVTGDPELVPLDERVAGAERVEFLGPDPMTGTLRWHRPGRTELHYADGTVDIIPD